MSQASEHSTALTAADINNPFYYQENFITVIKWVTEFHARLLLKAELELIDRFLTLPQQPQALLIRLLLRKGPLFRVAKLAYPEIDSITASICALETDGWLTTEALLGLENLANLFTKAELAVLLDEDTAHNYSLAKHNKATFIAALSKQSGQFAAPEQVVSLGHHALFQRLRLMFFGTLRQDFSAFVTTELGHTRYEQVKLTTDTCAFQCRSDVDTYLYLDELSQNLEQACAADMLAALKSQAAQSTSLWLTRKRSRLLFDLGVKSAREQQFLVSNEAFEHSTHPAARLRLARSLERQGALENAFELACAAPLNLDEEVGFERLKVRVGKKISQNYTTVVKAFSPPSFQLTLAPHDNSVEWAALETLQRLDDTSSYHYCENKLFCALFGLAFWPAIFAPIQGAFFHPFQRQPNDLYDANFYSRRREIIEQQFELLTQDPLRLLQRWDEKIGLSNPFVDWRSTDRTLITLALSCINTTQLIAIFRRMLSSLYNLRRGFPDLIAFNPTASTFQLIEVKSPTDKLQDHQRAWLQFFAEQKIKASVCHILYSG